MKQTAVEWLIEQIINKHPIITQYLPNYTFDKELIEQAKEMEKQQIIQAACFEPFLGNHPKTVGEEYYNEEYNK